GAAAPELRVAGGRAGVPVHAGLDVERGLQAAAEVFGAADAEATARLYAGEHVDDGVAAGSVGVGHADAHVGDAVKAHGSLRSGSAGEGAKDGEREEGLLHVNSRGRENAWR